MAASLVRIGCAQAAINDCAEKPEFTFHDDLKAGLLWAKDENGAFLLITLDATGISPKSAGAVKQTIAASTGLAPERMSLSCSHTHSGIRCNDEKLGTVLAAAALRAKQDAAPACMAYARADTRGKLTVNRRLRVNKQLGTFTITFLRGNVCDTAKGTMEVRGQIDDFLRYGCNIYTPNYADRGVQPNAGPAQSSPAVEKLMKKLPKKMYLKGPLDPHIDVLAFSRTDGKPIGTLVRFACHPVIFRGTRTREYSADYPGVLTREIAQATGAPALFINGPCANVKPIIADYGEKETERFGATVAGLALAALKKAKPRPLTSIEFAKKEVPLDRAPDLLTETAPDFNQEVEKYKNLISQPFDPVEAKRALDRLMRVWAMGSKRSLERTLPLPFNLAAFNDVALVTLPGEIFAEISLDIKKRFRGRRVVTCSLTDSSSPSYVPIRSAIPDGGYEGTNYTLAPGSAEKMAEVAKGMLGTFYRR